MNDRTDVLDWDKLSSMVTMLYIS